MQVFSRWLCQVPTDRIGSLKNWDEKKNQCPGPRHLCVLTRPKVSLGTLLFKVGAEDNQH